MADLLLSWFSSAFPFFLIKIFGILFLQRQCAPLDFSSSSGIILQFSLTATLDLQMIHNQEFSCRTGANCECRGHCNLHMWLQSTLKILTNLAPAEMRLFMPDRPVLLPWHRWFPLLLYCWIAPTFTGTFSAVLGRVSGYIFYIDSTVLLVALGTVNSIQLTVI